MFTARLTEYSQHDTYLWQVVTVDKIVLWRRKDMTQEYSAWKTATDGLLDTLSSLDVTFTSIIALNQDEYRSITSLMVIPISVVSRLGDNRWLDSLFDEESTI